MKKISYRGYRFRQRSSSRRSCRTRGGGKSFDSIHESIETIAHVRSRFVAPRFSRNFDRFFRIASASGRELVEMHALAEAFSERVRKVQDGWRERVRRPGRTDGESCFGAADRRRALSRQSLSHHKPPPSIATPRARPLTRTPRMPPNFHQDVASLKRQIETLQAKVAAPSAMEALASGTLA
jgi:hypothetical protein